MERQHVCRGAAPLPGGQACALLVGSSSLPRCSQLQAEPCRPVRARRLESAKPLLQPFLRSDEDLSPLGCCPAQQPLTQGPASGVSGGAALCLTGLSWAETSPASVHSEGRNRQLCVRFGQLRRALCYLSLPATADTRVGGAVRARALSGVPVRVLSPGGNPSGVVLGGGRMQG